MDHLDKLRLNDITRRQVALPFYAIGEVSEYSLKALLGEALGDFVIHSKDDIEFLLKIIREDGEVCVKRHSRSH